MKNFFIRTFLSYFLLLIVALLINSISFYSITGKSLKNEIEERLIQITNSLKFNIINLLEKKEKLQKEIVEIGKKLNLRITIIDKEGNVLADSHKDPSKMENHRLREEVVTALRGEPKVFKRKSETLNEYMYYYALAIKNREGKEYILRVSFFSKAFSNVYKEITHYLIILMVSVLIFGFIISYFISLRYSSNLKSIYNFLYGLSSGNFSERIFFERPKEFKELGKLLNLTVERLQDLFETEKKEKEEIIAILENINEPLIILDEKGKLIYANKFSIELFNLKKLEDLYFWQIFKELELLEMVEKHLKEKGDLKREIKIEEKTFLVNLKYLKEIKESLIIFYDISSFKEIMRVKRDMVANISHEIKTPLTVIYGYLEMLEEGVKEENKNMVKKIMEQVQNLVNLTEEMLKLSSIENFKDQIKLQKLDISIPLKKAIEVYKIPIEKKGLYLKLNISEGLKEIMGSLKYLEILFLNLLDNSLKYTEKGGIEIKAYEKENNLIVEFQDTGEGIKKEDLPFIFERFYVSERGRTKGKGGFGLGLAISKHIMEMHRGKIEAKSDFGKGTNIILYFPLA